MFQTVRVNRAGAEAAEWMGTKRKFWFSRDGERWLFKAEERGTGEDWAEKIVCELAHRLGLPHVNYELAEEYDGPVYLQPGVICPQCAPTPLNLVLGNQLLLARDPNYPGASAQRYKVKEYTVEAVTLCVRSLGLPSTEWLQDLPAGIATSLDVFIGYILLDAWTANQDRHHENWGALRLPADPSLRLSPTFDHGASLARNLSDDERKDRLETRDSGRRVGTFAARARSAFYAAANTSRTLNTVDTFSAFAAAAPGAAKVWLTQLASVTTAEVESIIREVPPNRMSAVTRRFTLELLTVNQQRLLALELP
ncbi:hypothetical protein BH20VER3_BH20VER3_06000 [soil metagenome]